MLIAVYPGSFDPVTNGHIDIIKRASKIFDLVIIAVGKHAEKNVLFSTEERVTMLREATGDIVNVEVDFFGGLLSDYVMAKGAKIIVRGLRAVTDFDYELQMALTLKKLAPTVETVFMMTNNKYIYLSSSIVKEVAGYGGCIHGLVPENVEKALECKLGAV
ncbi:MAG: pantetheine-phosphate adenylyltransferase [Firmicutes bacterium]|nr:pantetheine-phosphate adenylyltransferase [Bacillota bacterium]